MCVEVALVEVLVSITKLVIVEVALLTRIDEVVAEMPADGCVHAS